MSKPAKIPALDVNILFAPDEIQTLLQNAFTAAANPSCGTLTDKRLAYCREFAKALVNRLEEQDVDRGHLSYQEGVAVLIGAALVLQVLHGKS